MKSQTVISKLCDLFSLFGMPAYVHSDRGSSFMSEELKSFLISKGIATSRTTPYNPRGNGLVEKSNGTIWRGITMALKSKNLPQSCWQSVLPDVLHSIRTLLCTSTNQTPHERMFVFPRRSGTGVSIPSWLATPGPVLLRRFVRDSKQEPLVDEVQLLEANNSYAHIRYPGGKEDTVSTRDLAPLGNHSMPSERPSLDKQLINNSESEFISDSTSNIENEFIPDSKSISSSENVLFKPVSLESNVNFQAQGEAQFPFEVAQKTTTFSPRVSQRATKGKPPDRLTL